HSHRPLLIEDYRAPQGQDGSFGCDTSTPKHGRTGARAGRPAASLGLREHMFATDAETWLEGLNPRQHTAVTHTGGPLLVLAGAGTGKTTTLCSRVAWLVSQGVEPERILLLTFTRRAAREMIQRARALVGRALQGRRGIVGGTFHSVAHRMVRLHGSSLGLSS